MVATDPFYHKHVPESHDPMISDPFWGPSSSSVDWCEKNYAHTRYVAEMWNTLSSIPLIFVCFYGTSFVRSVNIFVYVIIETMNNDLHMARYRSRVI